MLALFALTDFAENDHGSHFFDNRRLLPCHCESEMGNYVHCFTLHRKILTCPQTHWWRFVRQLLSRLAMTCYKNGSWYPGSWCKNHWQWLAWITNQPAKCSNIGCYDQQRLGCYANIIYPYFWTSDWSRGNRVPKTNRHRIFPRPHSPPLCAEASFLCTAESISLRVSFKSINVEIIRSITEP